MEGMSPCRSLILQHTCSDLTDLLVLLAERADALAAAGVAGMSPYYEATLPSANSVASIIPGLTAYATAAMPHLGQLGSLPIPLNLPPASLAQATRQVSTPRCLHAVRAGPCLLTSSWDPPGQA